MDVELVTTLGDEDAEPYRAHLAATFAELTRRLGTPANDRPARLFLFRTAWEYKDFLRTHGMDSAGSGGVFFQTPQLEGIATFTRGQGVNQILGTLQHEAFHALAHRLFPEPLPTWINEGLAQYFEDGLVLDDRLRLGPCDTRRLALIQREAADVPLDDFLELPAEGWVAMTRMDPQFAAMTYSTAWSLVRFLISADTPWRQQFAQTLRDLRRGEPHEAAMAWLREPRTMESLTLTWRQWLDLVEPDAMSVAVDRLITLGGLLVWLHDNKQRMPASIDEFRNRMRMYGMEIAIHSRGGVFLERVRGDDPRLFTDPGSDDGQPLELIPGSSPRTPPELCATATPCQPTLRWQRPHPAELIWRVDFGGSVEFGGSA